MNFAWDWRCGNSQGVDRFLTAPLNSRYGTGKSVADYLQKSQVAIYEGIRAMYEGYSRNKYIATGVIQWMLNNAWPEMIWHLYDYYLIPPAAYFGAKKGCETLHVQYAYDDRAVYIVNSLYAEAYDVYVTAEVYNLDGTVVFKDSVTVNRVDSDGVLKLFEIPKLHTVITSTSYILMLHLFNGTDDSTITDNTYWLSTTEDKLDWNNSTFYNTPCTEYSNFTALQKLAPVQLNVTYAKRMENNDIILDVTVENNDPSTIAFFIHLRVTKGENGDDVTPLFWDDNYFTLPAQKSKTVSVKFGVKSLDGEQPVLVTEVYNNISGGGKTL